MGSSRLPGKVLQPLAGRPVLGWVIRAAQEAEVGPVIVATSDTPADDAVEEVARHAGALVARGPLDDVLSRFLVALADADDGETVVRLTADCPLLDPDVIRMAVAAFEAGPVDYLSTVEPRSLPRGLDVEVTSVGALRSIDGTAEGVDRVHVTSALYRSPGHRLGSISFSPPAADLRLTLDTAEDLQLLEAVTTLLGDRSPSWGELVDLLRARPDLVALNAHVRQKEIEEG